jgi:Protein of unknown function (DUF2971)
MCPSGRIDVSTQEAPPPTTSYAGTDGIHTLYKFMRYPYIAKDDLTPDIKEKRRRVESLLASGELYFPTARQLNDPFESSPHFKIPESPKEAKEKFVADFRERHAQRLGFSKEEIDEKSQELSAKIDSGLFGIHVDGVIQKWQDKMKSDYPMCCLSATRESILMWSYYAEGHTGICVHFDSSNSRILASGSPFQAAQCVHYSEEYPVLQLPLHDLDPVVLHSRAFITKSTHWDHEKEYRLVNLLAGSGDSKRRIFDDLFKWAEPQLAIVRPSHIVGVTIGASMPETEIENILRICHDRPARTPVWRAKRSDDRFELRFEKLQD